MATAFFKTGAKTCWPADAIQKLLFRSYFNSANIDTYLSKHIPMELFFSKIIALLMLIQIFAAIRVNNFLIIILAIS
jgi:hypothetical protein